jgi:hypothetical protein
MPQSETPPSETRCVLCRRPGLAWFLRLSVQDAAGYREEAFICANCAVKLRLASEKMRDLQIDPWVHDAVARVLRGSSEGKEKP